MTQDSRVVLDTNLIVSAVLSKHSISRRAFDKAFEEGVVLISEETVAELNDVLKRKKFEKYVSEEERIQFLTAFVRKANLIEVTEKVTASRDPKDDKFLSLAISAKAKCIVSGDKDLLVLNPFKGISIITPRGFLNQS